MTHTKLRWIHSINGQIFFTLLVLVLFGVTSTTLLSLYNAKKEFQNDFKDNIKTTAALNKDFIENWYNYRKKDTSFLAESLETKQLIQNIEGSLHHSKVPLEEIVYTKTYNAITAKYEHIYENFLNKYKYTHNIMLFDTQLNMIYSYMQESDFATNFNNGPFANTNLAKILQQTLKSRKSYLSDYAPYEPSDFQSYTFISYPVIKNQKMIGIFVMQVQHSAITNYFQQLNEHSNIQTYLTDTDGYITTLTADSNHTHFMRKDIFSHIDFNASSLESFETAKEFISYENLHILTKKFLLINIIDKSALKHQYITIFKQEALFFLIILGLITLLSYIASRKIARPMEQLLKIAQVITEGKNIHSFKVDAKNEFLLLAHALQEMYEKLQSDKKELELLNVAAHEATKAKSDFLASMSHEIRTPMNGVIGMLTLLEKTDPNKQQTHYIHLANASATALLTLINDILDFSKIEAGKLEIEHIEFDFLKDLGDFAEVMALRAQKNNNEIVLDFSQVNYTHLIGDKHRIRQIMTNLVGNAIKFTHDGTIIIEAKLDEKLSKLIVTIRDNGIGIAAEKLPKLFEAFTQAESSTTRKYGGTGLGLSIVKKLCMIMGGNIEATSVVGEGSTFTFNVKIQILKEKRLPLPPCDTTEKHLLVVDDNLSSLESIYNLLQKFHFNVTMAHEAKEALSSMQNQHFNIVFIDINMEKIDGIKLAKIIRSINEYKNIKLVAMTSIDATKGIDYYTDIGFDSFFPKPVTLNDILHTFTRIHTCQTTEATTHKQEDLQIAKIESYKILLVEDNLTNQIVAQAFLEDLHLQCDVANNGQEALDILNANQEEPYNLILMDCQMPILDGYSTTEAIRRGDAGTIYTDITIIAMTANAMHGDKEKCFSHGMNDYIAKPIIAKTFKDTLHKYIELKDE